jgi:hypothetical protein
MNKEFVPYEQSLELRKLEFSEPCFTWYWDDIGLYNGLEYDNHNKREHIFSAPTFSQAFRWFREKHELDSEIYMNHEYGVKFYTYLVLKLEKSIVSHKSGYAVKQNTYEEAELECLKKLIEIVKNK